MSQDGGDPIIANGQETLSVSRPKIKDAVAALRTKHSGATAQSYTVADMQWADTTLGWVRERDPGDSYWAPLWARGGNPLAACITNLTNADSPYTPSYGGTYHYDTSGGASTFQLPAIGSGNKGWVLAIKKADSSLNALTIQRAGSDTIEGATSVAFTNQYRVLICYSEGTGTTWWRWHEGNP